MLLNRKLVLLAMMSGFVLTACETVPDSAPVEAEPVEEVTVEIYQLPEPEPEPVPSIDIKEYERQQAEKEAALRAYEASIAPAAIPAPPKPVVKLTLAERLERAASPDKQIEILSQEEESAEVKAFVTKAYQDKLAADKAAGNVVGAANALVFLGQEDAAKNTREGDFSALEKFAEAQTLDAENEAAPRLVSQVRGELQSYADGLHKEAVAFFVKQDFAPAVSRWEKVLLIDPGNTAARNWFVQASEALSR